jgi:hypothetical protein
MTSVQPIQPFLILASSPSAALRPDLRELPLPDRFFAPFAGFKLPHLDNSSKREVDFSHCGSSSLEYTSSGMAGSSLTEEMVRPFLFIPPVSRSASSGQ